MCQEELEHDYKKKNEKPLQSAYFIILMRTKAVTMNLRGDMKNLKPLTFNSFIRFVYYMTKHVPNIDFVIMRLFIIVGSF